VTGPPDTAMHRENAEVLPSGSVAVAVTLSTRQRRREAALRIDSCNRAGCHVGESEECFPFTRTVRVAAGVGKNSSRYELLATLSRNPQWRRHCRQYSPVLALENSGSCSAPYRHRTDRCPRRLQNDTAARRGKYGVAEDRRRLSVPERRMSTPPIPLNAIVLPAPTSVPPIVLPSKSASTPRPALPKAVMPSAATPMKFPSTRLFRAGRRSRSIAHALWKLPERMFRASGAVPPTTCQPPRRSPPQPGRCPTRRAARPVQ